jgi:hypothetical protein
VKEIKEKKRKFTLDREKYLLTLVLGNDEHRGRARGFGPSYPWWLGFAKDQETYRSRARAKKRQQDEENGRFNQLLARVNKQQQQIDKFRGVVRLKILHSILLPTHLSGKAAWLNQRPRLIMHDR